MTRPAQLTLRFAPPTHGGAREGAGRKPSPHARREHVRRPSLARSYPVHVNWKLLPHVGDLRVESKLRVLETCFHRGRDRFGFRLVHYSVQNRHIHLIVEAEDARALGRGIKGLGVRIARALNKLAGTHGSVLAERYHMVILRYPKQVRNALCYVLNNGASHMARRGLRVVGFRMDAASSGTFFDGWKEGTAPCWRRPAVETVVPPRTELLRTLWKRHGPIAVGEVAQRYLAIKQRR